MTLLLLALVPALLAGVCTLAIAMARWRVHDRPWVVLALQSPAGAKLDLEPWVLFFRSLYGIVAPWWKEKLRGQPHLCFELTAREGAVSARCWLMPELEGMVSTLLRTALPGTRITRVEPAIPLAQPCARARLKVWRESVYPLGQPRSEPLTSVVNALAAVPEGIVQIAISPDTGWQRQALGRLDDLAGIPSEPSPLMNLVSGVVGLVFDLFWSGAGNLPRQQPRSHAEVLPPISKAGQLGYRTELRLRVAAPTAGLARRYLQTVCSAFRALDGSNGLRSQRVWRRRRFDRALQSCQRPGARAPVFTPEELAHLFHLPIGAEAIANAPVQLAPSWLPSSDGKVICLADDQHRTPIAMSPADSRHHLHLMGPTGAGKSTELLNLALDDVAAGRGCGVIDPTKGDLVRDLKERIPRPEWDRVVLIDPSVREYAAGINVLECDDPDRRELVADQLTTIFHRAYERWWGPRTDDIFRAAILTLLHQSGASICMLPLLLLQPERWRHLIDRVNDPAGLGSFWEEYLRSSDAERLRLAGPVLSKLRAVLLRPSVRAILGQSRSTVDFARIMDRDGILLVSLPKGLIGEETSRLLGSFICARIWQAATARASRPEAWRPDWTLYLDEFQNYFVLPQTPDEILVEARGYHLSLVLAHQFLGQLPATLREALAGNARSRVVFQLGQEDARYMAREMAPLTDHDLRNLQPYQVAARLYVNGRTETPFTGTTRPAPPSLGDDHARALTELALARYGRPRLEVEREIASSLRAMGLPPGGVLDLEWA